MARTAKLGNAAGEADADMVSGWVVERVEGWVKGIRGCKASEEEWRVGYHG